MNAMSLKALCFEELLEECTDDLVMMLKELASWAAWSTWGAVRRLLR